MPGTSAIGEDQSSNQPGPEQQQHSRGAALAGGDAAAVAASAGASAGAAAAAADAASGGRDLGVVRRPGRVPLHAYCEDCTVSKPSPMALDDELACTLWEMSEALAARHMSDSDYVDVLYPSGLA